MKRCLSFLLLCLAMLAVPVQGAAAAVMMVCSAAQAMADSSMLTRHASVKSVAESGLQRPGAALATCHEATTPAMTAPAREHRTGLESVRLELDAHGVEFTAQPAVATPHALPHSLPHATPHHGVPEAKQDRSAHDIQTVHGADSHGGLACAACAQCALGTMLMPQLPALLLAHHGHALPQTPFAAFVEFLPDADLRPPAARC